MFASFLNLLESVLNLFHLLGPCLNLFWIFLNLVCFVFEHFVNICGNCLNIFDFLLMFGSCFEHVFESYLNCFADVLNLIEPFLNLF